MRLASTLLLLLTFQANADITGRVVATELGRLKGMCQEAVNEWKEQLHPG
jgi:hypothetical protein